MAKKKPDLSALIDKFIETQNLEDIVGDRFGKYSKYIIQDRALPDVRDGLKPVQRRILYALHKLHLTPDKPYKKSARIVGDVIGKYHPHGDSSVYDAMVRMAQDFKFLVPLIDMHGNKGSIDGDPAAAMRYTEAKMAKASQYLLQDIDKRTVGFVPNFDDEELEPVVLPARFPNLLINGASGISSGYATEIPSHNLKEVIQGTIYRMRHPESSLAQIMRYIKGPDFPTGGIVQGIEGIKDAFETGRGKVILRAKTQLESDKIIIEELPYDVNKATLVRKIDELRFSKKIDGIKEVRDETSKEGLRIVIDIKKSFEADQVLNFLMKKTDLVKSYHYNMVAIHDQRPMQMGLLALLDAYITHQKEVVTNRANYDLRLAKKRLHIVDGIIRMTEVIDEVIALIRASKNKASAKSELMNALGFTDEQAEAILILQLYKLSNTDVDALKNEKADLEATIERLTRILSNEEELEQSIEDELRGLLKEISHERLTLIEEEIEKITVEEQALIKHEQMMLGISQEGYVRLSSFRSFSATDEATFKDGDGFRLVQEVSTLDTLLVFLKSGDYLFYPIYKIPESKWKDPGVHINTLLQLDERPEIIHAEVRSSFDTDETFLLTTADNRVKRSSVKDYLAQRYHRPIKAIGLKKGDSLVDVRSVPANAIEVVTISKLGHALKYDLSEIPLTGLSAQGVKAMNLSSKDALVASVPLKDGHDLLVLTSRGTIKRMDLSEIAKKRRTLSPVALYKPVKTKPYHVVDAMLLSGELYKTHANIHVLTSKETISINAFDLKRNAADTGKALIAPKHGTPIHFYPEILIDVEPSALSEYTQAVTHTPEQLSLEVNDESRDA